MAPHVAMCVFKDREQVEAVFSQRSRSSTHLPGETA
jgi:hypothetical protein